MRYRAGFSGPSEGEVWGPRASAGGGRNEGGGEKGRGRSISGQRDRERERERERGGGRRMRGTVGRRETELTGRQLLSPA